MSKPGRSQGQGHPRLKLVVRRLPPTLPAATFWHAVEPFVDKSVWRRYVPGRAGDSYGNHPVHSRAYVLMSDLESLVSFHTGFDGHVFRSKTGDEYQAVVEYAPIEKTPYRATPKADARQGTIDDDPDYVSFMASLGQVEDKPSLEVSAPVAQPTSTPIIDALRASANKSKNKAAKRKEKEKEKKAKEKEDKGGKGAAKGGNAGVKAAALAAVNSAATKRAPQDRGTVMVAGKGREVFVAEDASGDKEKKKRKPKKKKEEGEGSQDPVREESSADSKRGGKRGRGRGRGGAVGEASSREPREAGDARRARGAPRGRGRGETLAPRDARIDM